MRALRWRIRGRESESTEVGDKGYSSVRAPRWGIRGIVV